MFLCHLSHCVPAISELGRFVLPIRYLLKQHAHVEIVTVTDAVLIHIELAIVNNLRNCDLISNCSQFLKLFTIASCKLHLSMLSSVWLCCLSDIALILVTFQNIQEKVLRNREKYESSNHSGFFLHILKSYSDIVQYLLVNCPLIIGKRER